MNGFATDKVFRAPPPKHKIARPLGRLLAEAPDPEEFVIQPNGQVRQAGATTPEDLWVSDFRLKAEKHLYVFEKSVLGLDWLTDVHKDLCTELQTPRKEPWRVGCLEPREIGKSTIGSRGMPLHIFIQPKERNVYFPGERGVDQRIALICETADRAESHLSVLQQHADSNALLRALWPDCFWSSPPRRNWNASALTFPWGSGPRVWPDPSIWAMGVGAAITGAHPSMLLKDDIISFDAMNSDVVMQTAIEWHVLSRALINRTGCIEVIIGTRWTISDLYAYVQHEDDSVKWIIRSIIEEGKSIWPEQFPMDKINRIRKELGPLFMLQYMNNAYNPELTDFQQEDLRSYSIKDGQILYTEDARDIELIRMAQAPIRRPNDPDPYRGLPLTPETYERMKKEVGHAAALRLRAA